jgi:O-antigen ligase
MLALGAVCLVGIILKQEDVFYLKFAMLLFFLILIFLALVQTGSKGALISLIAGILCYVIAKTESRLTKMHYVLISILMVILSLGIVYFQELSRVRVEDMLYYKYYSSRDVIAIETLQMIIEMPLFGWGPFTNVIELGARTGSLIRDTHNTFLLVLTEVGILGAMPYFIGYYLCVKSSIKASKTLFNPIPFALVITLTAINLSLTWHHRKFYWFILALALASGLLENKEIKSTNTVSTNAL